MTPEIGVDVAARGFFGAVMSIRSIDEQQQFLVEALGFRKIGVDGGYHRFEAPNAGPGAVMKLLHEPERPPGTWFFGAGTAHHIAFNVETDEALVAQKQSVRGTRIHRRVRCKGSVLLSFDVQSNDGLE